MSADFLVSISRHSDRAEKVDKHVPMCGKMADNMYMVLRIAAMAICLLDAPVMTSFPDENKSAVVFGSSMRMVIAANLFLLYALFGIHPEIISRSILSLLVLM